MSGLSGKKKISLALEDGTVLSGVSAGISGTVFGEFVFNTAMSGYEEVLTDPSYAGQIVTMTSPMIGNTGITREDAESSGVHLSGFVAREIVDLPSNHRSRLSLPDYFQERGVVAASGIDTRLLTLRLRDRGVLRGILTTEEHDPATLRKAAKEVLPISEVDLVGRVASRERTTLFPEGPSSLRVVLIDYGAKASIARYLLDQGIRVTVVPPRTTARQILDDSPDGVILSNGPGDPAILDAEVEEIRGLVGRLPLFGICLGHQLLARAVGARTFKLPFGHHGINHPVLDLRDGRVLITSQNHNYAVDPRSLPAGAIRTFESLYDHSLEGLWFREARIYSVQFHPESAPGPHDARSVFSSFHSILVGEDP
ncbi:MAG: glutamine-hydrolyzing carbamoyl-phosphate synthase small subunit [Leptospirillia bacterium]